MHYLAVFIGGGFGSLARYAISIYVVKSKFTNFPLATLISNTLACAILAVGVYCFKEKLDSNSWLSPLLIAGFCGGFSTFSTFSNETFQLMQNGNYFWAVTNVLLSVLVGLGLIWMINSAKG